MRAQLPIGIARFSSDRTTSLSRPRKSDDNVTKRENFGEGAADQFKFSLLHSDHRVITSNSPFSRVTEAFSLSMWMRVPSHLISFLEIRLILLPTRPPGMLHYTRRYATSLRRSGLPRLPVACSDCTSGIPPMN